METEYPKAFLKDMEKRDRNLPKEGPDIHIGNKDRKGNLLILGGRNANIWRTPSGMYIVGVNVVPDAETAVDSYNKLNGVTWDLDHITKNFQPWYDKNKLGIGEGGTRFITKVPSRSSNKEYNVSYDQNGNLMCDCPGFRFRGECWHTEAVAELLKEKPE